MKRKYLFVGVIAFLAVAFAAVTTTLVMRGGVMIAENTEDYAIYFSKSVINDKDESKRTISTDGQALTFDAKMNTLGDVTKLDYEVTNASKNYDAKVSVECELEDQTEGGSPVNIDKYLSIEYSNLESIIPARETGTGSIIVTMKRSMVNDVKLGLKCDLKFDANERDSLGITPSGSSSSNYSYKGYLVDKNDYVLTNTNIVILGNDRKIINTGNVEGTFFTIEGLDMGFHEVYIIEGKTLNEINKMSDDEIKENATTSAKFTQSSKEIVFDNGYKIVEELFKREFILTFDAQGGSVNPSSKKIYYSETYGDLPTPTLAGYNFLGWYTDTEYTNEVKDSQKIFIKENKTIYAKWKAKTYTVSFNSNSGSSVASKKVIFNTTFGDLETPIRERYNFLGWFLGDKQITSDTKYTLARDITLNAKWEGKKQEINVNIDGNEKEVIIDISKPIVSSLPEIKKEGYTFLGWYSLSNNKKIDDDELLVEDNKDLYTKYEANKYQVMFDGNTGKVSEEEKLVTYDNKYGKLEVPTKQGYNFVGWFTAKVGGEQVTEDTIVKITDKQTLYARWSAKTDITYTVKHWQQKLDSLDVPRNEVNYTLVNTEVLKGTADSNVTPNVKFYEGFTSPDKTTIQVKTDGSAELNYYYIRNIYTLTVNQDIGVESVNVKNSYKYEEEVNIEYLIKKGYTFKEITGDKDTQSFIMPARNTSIRINTTEDVYTIIYNLDDGILDKENPREYKVTSNDITLANPTKRGYTFTGWTGSNGENKEMNIVISKGSIGNKNYQANYNPNTYTVSFDASGGEEVGTVLTVTYDSTYGDTLPMPNRNGYTFLGWYTDTANGNRIIGTTKVNIIENQVLYAHWEANTYQVNFDTNGGNELSSTLDVTYNKNYGDLPVPTKLGHTFIGWYTKTQDGDLITSETKVNVTENQTLYALWKANSYFVTLKETEDDETPVTISVIYGEKYGTLPNPTKGDIKKFKGWYTGLTDGAQINEDTEVKIIDNQVLYARWKPECVYQLGKVWTYGYTGGSQTLSIPEGCEGDYKIELWGASGGGSRAQGAFQDIGGKGAYVSGTVKLQENKSFYIFVGGQGANAQVGRNSAGGWNGGGYGTWDNHDDESSGGGGGATDFRIQNGSWDDAISLKTRIIVAAGGGGGSFFYSAGAAGGLTGYTNYGVSAPGSQTSGYAFGRGRDGWGIGDNDGVAGGGSGYYGGQTSNTSGQSSGAGGSSFISGHEGCNAIDASGNHTDQPNHYLDYIFKDTLMIDGLGYRWKNTKAEQQAMPKPDGTSYAIGVGHSGNGYAKITLVSLD